MNLGGFVFYIFKFLFPLNNSRGEFYEHDQHQIQMNTLF